MEPQGKSGKMKEEKEPLPQTKPKEAPITAGKSNEGSRRRRRSRRKPPAKGEGDAAPKEEEEEEEGSASLREKEEAASTRQGGAAFVAVQADPPTEKKPEGEKPDLGARKKSSKPRKKEEEEGSASLREKEEAASTRQGGAAFVAVQADSPTGKKPEGGKPDLGARKKSSKPRKKEEEEGSASLREKEEAASTRQGGAAFVAVQADSPTGKKPEGGKPDLGARKKSSKPRKKEEEEGSASLREKEEAASTRQGGTAFVAVQADPPTGKKPEGEKPDLGARKKSSKPREKKEEEEKGKEVGGGSPNGRRGLPEKGSEGKARRGPAPGTKKEEEEEEGICAPRGAAPAPAPAEGPGPRRGRPSCSALLPQAQAQAQPLRQVLERLKLAKEMRSEAAQLVNLLRDRLVKAIKKPPCFEAIDILGTGSYYERVKICRPNEFDIMLKVPNVRVELEPCKAGASSGAFYYVKLKRDCANKKLKEFCDDDERLSSSNMLLKLRSIIIEEVKKMKDMDVSVERKRPGCPAVTLLIGRPPSVISVDIILGLEFYHSKWFTGTENGLGIEEWLGTKVKKSLRFEPLYLVPKNVKDGQHFIDTWRLSFSKIEKIILHNHGQTKTCCEIKGVKCCRKDCLKLLKYLLEQLKTKHEDRNQFDKFCSYQVKTAFFHACVLWPKDDDWLPANLDECFMRLLNYFLNCLREAKLPHFFIRTFNFFCEERIERTKRNALIRAIEREINNRYPAFFDS